MICQKALLFLFTLPLLINPSTPIKCVRCDGLECTDLKLKPETCPGVVKGCISILTEGWVESNRFEIARNCYTEEYQKKCTPLHLANQTCEYCDHKDGCNVERKEPLICKQCDYVSGTKGFTCETAVVCHPLFRTVTPQCHISWAGHVDGTHYGCWHQMNRRARLIQLHKDPVNLQTKRCDSNSCNGGVVQLFENHTDLLELRRFCYTGGLEDKSLVHCRNVIYREPIVTFCMFAWEATASILRRHDCYSLTYLQTNVQR